MVKVSRDTYYNVHHGLGVLLANSNGSCELPACSLSDLYVKICFVSHKVTLLVYLPSSMMSVDDPESVIIFMRTFLTEIDATGVLTLIEELPVPHLLQV